MRGASGLAATEPTRLLPVLVTSVALGCGGVPEGNPGATPSGAPLPARPGPDLFMGLPDDQGRELGDDHPRSPLAGVEIITKVQEVTYDAYLAAKQDGTIH